MMTGSQPCALAPGKYPWRGVLAEGPSARELAGQALSSVEGGYDLLAPKFDHTPFRTPDGVLDATAAALGPLGPFGRGLDVCCGTGAGLRVLNSLCQGPVTGVDFSTGMLAQARRAHPAPRGCGPTSAPCRSPGGSAWRSVSGRSGTSCPRSGPRCSPGCTARCGRAGCSPSRSLRRCLSPRAGTGRWPGSTWPCGSATRLWRPPFVMYYRACPLSRGPGRPGSIRIHRDHGPPDGPGLARGRQPEGPACPRPNRQHTLTAGQSVQAPARPARGWPVRRDGQQNPALRGRGPAAAHRR